MSQRFKGGMTKRQEMFAVEFLKDRNARAAAARAGYSPSTCANIAVANMKNPAILAKIREATEERSDLSGVSAAFVLKELKKVAEQEDVAQSTKVRALELIAKHLGMLEDRLTLKTDSLSPEQRAERVAILIERASRRE